MICAWCNEKISQIVADKSHIHHNDLLCLPSEDDGLESIIHVITCEYTQVFHDTCCPWCEHQPAICGAE